MVAVGNVEVVERVGFALKLSVHVGVEVTAHVAIEIAAEVVGVARNVEIERLAAQADQGQDELKDQKLFRRLRHRRQIWQS